MINRQPLFNRLICIHLDCCSLIKQTIGHYLPVAGNIGVFCQSDGEYEDFTRLAKELTFTSKNPDQKYFQLKVPITCIIENNDVPEMTYTHLYIRKPDLTSYGKYLGDVDFVLSPKEYKILKDKVKDGKAAPGMEIYDRTGWDTIQITNPKINSVAYISTQSFAEKVRVKF